MSEHLLYIRKDSNELGPFTLNQLRSMWSRGEVTVKTSYCVDGESEWKELRSMLAVLEAEAPLLGVPATLPPSLPQGPPPLPEQLLSDDDEYVPPGGKQALGCLALILAGIFVLVIYVIANINDEPLKSPYPTRLEEPSDNSVIKAKEELAQPEGLPTDSKDAASISASLGKTLIESIKSHLTNPDSLRFLKQTSFIDLGDFNQTIILFSADNESGGNKQYEATAHVSHDGNSVALVKIEELETATPIYEDGTNGAKVQLVKSWATTATTEDGEEFVMVYLNWKNVGKTPIHAVKATIRAKNKNGEVIKLLSPSSPSYVYVADDNKGIQPGETYVEPEGMGFNLGKLEVLKSFGFRNSDVRIEKAYGRRGLEGLLPKSLSSATILPNQLEYELDKQLQLFAPLPVENKHREKLLESQFSSWDGSHIKLVEMVKKEMHDPSSFEHVETKYWEMGDHLIINMTFTGANSLGGKVRTTVKASSTLEGDEVKIIEKY